MSRTAAARRTRPAALLFAVAWLAYFGMLQWSVVRFRVTIVVTLTVAAGLLAGWLLTRARVVLDPVAAAVVLVGGLPLALAVPLYSYVAPAREQQLRILLGLAGVCCAIALALVRRPLLAWLGAVTTYALVGAVVIRADPAPRIDVWVTLQQAADALADGVNFYTVSWVGSPGVKDAFTYLPWSAVLLAPGRLLAGDVRWMMLVWVVVAAVGLLLLGRTQPAGATGADAARARAAAGAVTAVVLLAPGTLTQIDQAWTEPLLFTGLVWWALLMARNRPWAAVLPLALACASKQHLAALLLVLLVWRPFGAARTLATGALTGLLVLPWFLTAPRDFVHDTITFLVSFHPIRFANTWYLLALNKFGITLPFWLTGLVVLATVAVAMVVIWRRDPPLGVVLRWTALVLLVANLVNKQAFYNQYWLVGAIVALSLLVDTVAPAGGSRPATARSAATAPTLSRRPDAPAAPVAPGPRPRPRR